MKMEMDKKKYITIKETVNLKLIESLLNYHNNQLLMLPNSSQTIDFYFIILLDVLLKDKIVLAILFKLNIMILKLAIRISVCLLIEL